MKRILIVFFAFLVGNIYANNIKITDDMYFGYDGILVQTFENGATIQTEIVHTYMILGDLGVLDSEFYLPEIDEAYVEMLNTMVSHYVDSCFDEYYSWYRYDVDRVADVTLKRPFNRVYIDLIITPESFERNEFVNIDFRYCFNGARTDNEIRRISLRGVKNKSSEQLILQFKRGLIFSGCIVTKYNLGGISYFAMENVVQPKENSVDMSDALIFKVKGVKKTKVNLPPDNENDEDD